MRSRQGGRRGFTLAELLASIAIIAVLAAVATPSFIALMRDRRVVRAGMILAESYREGRTRALSRGNVVIVRWRAGAGDKGKIEMRESVIAPAGTALVTRCSAADDWTDTSVDTRLVSAFDFAGTTYALAQIKLYSEANADSPFAELCFAPQGRTYVRYLDGGPFVPLTGVPHYEITNAQTTTKRTVFLPPNGVARLQL